LRFKYNYLKCDFEYVPNDVTIQLLSYLTDEEKNVFVSTSTLDTDTFTVQTYKSSLPLTSAANGLQGNVIYDCYVLGSNIYASTDGGLSISKDSGLTWSTLVQSIKSSFAFTGNKVYAASDISGIYVSFNNGSTWVNKTTENGLPSNIVHHVIKTGSVLYAGTDNGLAISTNDGSNWKTILKDIPIRRISVSGTYIYAATPNGVQISSNSGITWINKTVGQGLGSNSVNGIFSSTGTTNVYAATYDGVSISTNRGTSWSNKLNNGLGSNIITGVYYSSGTIYAATIGGLSSSTNGGTSWVNKTVTDGLGDNYVYNVFLFGNTIYASTNYGLSVYDSTWKNLIKTPPNYISFLTILIGKKISEKYNSSKGGFLTKDGKIISQIENTEGLVNGMTVQGTGVPKDTYLVGVRDKNSVEVSNAVTVSGKNTLTFNTLGWEIDFTELDKLVNVVRFDLL